MISNIGIILAPIFFAASVYMMLGRIILVSGGREKSLISPRWLTKIFVLGDIVAFLIQAYGKIRLFLRLYFTKAYPLIRCYSSFKR
jgi:hypothetical protein